MIELTLTLINDLIEFKSSDFLFSSSTFWLNSSIGSNWIDCHKTKELWLYSKRIFYYEICYDYVNAIKLVIWTINAIITLSQVVRLELKDSRTCNDICNLSKKWFTQDNMLIILQIIYMYIGWDWIIISRKANYESWPSSENLIQALGEVF